MHAALLGLLALASASLDREALERGCEECHATTAAEWRQSFHRKAYTNAAYVRALKAEPRPFCRRCHAPEADPQTAATGWQAESGVACVTCHVRDGKVVTGHSLAYGQQKKAPHVVLREDSFATTVCRSCHEFGFPDAILRERRELMQSTVSEHKAMGEHRSCVDCHMPLLDKQRSHRFPGGHDDDLLRGALKVSAKRDGAVLQLALHPKQVGHALPTGDLFRRLVVTAQSQTSDGKPVHAEQYLQRRFGTEQQRPGSFVRVQTSDTRLYGPALLQLSLPLSDSRSPIHWQVRYQRVAHPGQTEAAAVLDGEVLLYQGVIP